MTPAVTNLSAEPEPLHPRNPGDQLFPPRTFLTITAGFFLLLILLRWEIVDSPPYYDFVIGIWPEADYLAKTGFDYRALRFDETHSLDVEGGQRSYMISILPTLLALGILTLPTPEAVRIAYHLATFLSAALLGSMLVALVRPRFAWSTSLLFAMATLSTPVLCVQIDMTGMEIPLTTAAVGIAFLLQRGAFTSAAIFSFIAFAIKPTGVLTTVALLVVFAVRLYHDVRDRLLWRAFGLSLLVLGIEGGLLLWSEEIYAQARQGPPAWMALIWCPDLLLIVAAAGAFGIMRSFRQRRVRTEPTPSRLAKNETSVLLFSYLLLAGLFVSLSQVAFIPRYLTLAVPFLYLIIALTVLPSFRREWLRTGLLGGIVVANGINWNGILFPESSEVLRKAWGPLANDFVREGSFLERSHEYLQDHRENLAAMKQLARYEGEPVILGIPFAYFAAFPILGYVDKPIPAYVINGFSDCAPGYKSVMDLLADRPIHPLILRTANVFYGNMARFNLPAANGPDEILYESANPSPIQLYRKHWNPDPPAVAAVERWYWEQVWPRDSMADRIDHLWNQGGQGQLSAELTQWNESGQREGVWSLCLASILESMGDSKEAVRLATPVILDRPEHRPTTRDLEPSNYWPRTFRMSDRRFERELATQLQNPELLVNAGLLCLKQRRMAMAADCFQVYLENRIEAIRRAGVEVDLGEKELETGNIRLAKEHLSKAIAIWPAGPWAYYHLGLAASAENRPHEAIAALQKAVDLAPNYSRAHLELGILLAKNGERDQARRHFREAVRLDPSIEKVARHVPEINERPLKEWDRP